MHNVWIYTRKLVEWLVISTLGHGIILYLATIEIFPDKVAASMITTVVGAPAWAHWMMAGLFGLMGTFLLEVFFWNRRSPLAHFPAANPGVAVSTANIGASPDMKISDAIDYIVNDSKTIFDKPHRPETPRDFPPGASMAESNTIQMQARRRLGDKINIGAVRVWGRRQIETKLATKFESSLREVPAAYWDDMQIDFHSAKYYCADQPWSQQTSPIPGKIVTYNWTDINVNRAQIEELWPKKDALK